MSAKLKFPYDFEDVSEEIQDLATKCGAGKLLRLKGTRICVLDRVKQYGEVIYNFKPRPDDVWLIGFPRSGTTFIQEIVYLIGTDLNYEQAAAEIMDDRFPFLEKAFFSDKNEFLPTYPHEKLEQMTHKRFIKSHFGFQLLHPSVRDAKVVFVARNPKDAIHSLAHYPGLSHTPGYHPKVLWLLFLEDAVSFGNYFDLLSKAWSKRNDDNMLFLFYEEASADKSGTIRRIADFLGKTVSGEEIEKLSKHVDIESFRANKSLNNDHIYGEEKNGKFAFIRKGTSGGWRDDLPEDLVGPVDRMIKENLDAIPDFVVPESWIAAMDLKC